MAEILADYVQHRVGDRAVVNWTRPYGQTYLNVPVVYLRQVTADDYFARFPDYRREIEAAGRPIFYWEVSVD